MTGFLGATAGLGTQLLLSDDETNNAAYFIWSRVPGGPLSDDFRWARSRLGSGGGIGLFTMTLDAARQVWDWYSWVMPGSVASVGQKYHSISGITKDPYGNVIVSATVDMFRTVGDVKIGTTVSDPVTGAFTVTGLNDAETVYLVAYKVGSPDITGATVNTLVTGY